MKISANNIKNILCNLPHAFDKLYWSMADTTYEEELFLAIIKAYKIPKEEAIKLQSKIFPGNKILKQILKEEIVECMGCYGKGYIGVSFYGSYENKYNGEGKGTTLINLKYETNKD